MSKQYQLENKIKDLIFDFNNRKFEKVISKSKAILNKYPKIEFVSNVLGLSYIEIKDYDKASFIFQDIIKNNPLNFAARSNYGMLLRKINQDNEAEIIFNKILTQNENHISSLNNLANLKKDDSKFDEAIKLYKKLLSLDKNNIISKYNLSLCYRNIRKKNEALNEAYQIIELNPNFTKADEIISSLTNYSDDKKNHLNLMLEREKKINFSEEEKISLYFSIGKAYEDLKNYETAFNYYLSANQISDKLYKFDVKEEWEKLNLVKKTFFQIKNIDLNFSLPNQKKIIFICGMPRSGSTLLEQIISTHKDIESLGETDFLNQSFLNHNFFDNDISKKIILNSNKDKINYLAEYYFNKIKRLNLSENTLTDKSLLNFQYIGFIKIFFPNSKIIIITRDFKNNFLSIFKNNLPFLKWTNNIEKIREFYSIFLKYLDFWEKESSDSILKVNYAELVNQTELQSKKIIQFCGLEWDPNCLEYYTKNKSAIKTASVNQADRPIYNSSINKFKEFEKYFK